MYFIFLFTFFFLLVLYFCSIPNSMSARLQLAIKGIENSYLSYKPTNSLFQSSYKRLTNFALESDSIAPTNGGVSFDSKFEFVIPNNGDLLSDLFLQIDVDMNSDMVSDIAWVNGLGHAIIESIDLKLSNKLLCTLSGKLLDVLSEFIPQDKKRGYDRMIGKKSRINFFNQLNDDFDQTDAYKKRLTLPLKFWFTKHVSNAFPLFRLRNENLKLVVKLRSLQDCLIKRDALTNQYSYDSIIKTSLIATYIHLDGDEIASLRMKKKNNHIIEQYQYETFTVNENDKNIKLDLKFNHPIKELLWIVQRNDRNEVKIENSDGESLEHFENIHYGNDEFNYSSAIPYFQPLKESFKMLENDNGMLFEKAKILFNGKIRNKSFSSDYYRFIQPYQHHSTIPENNIYSYSFSINSDHFQPNGFCNFTPIDCVTLEMTFNNYNAFYRKQISVYSINYNMISFDKHSTKLMFE